MRTVTVVGGGASGMMAAITAAECGVRVILLEHNARVGKKILSTGNGRCNFTNIHQEPLCYRSEDPLFPWGIIQKFSAQDTIAFFLKLGVQHPKTGTADLYPNSDQASAVLDVLRMELSRLNVDVRTEQECLEIRPVHPSRGKHSSQEDSAGFSVRTDKESFFTDRVILCAGSKAAPSSGSDGSGYSLAKKAGTSSDPCASGSCTAQMQRKFLQKHCRCPGRRKSVRLCRGGTSGFGPRGNPADRLRDLRNTGIPGEPFRIPRPLRSRKRRLSGLISCRIIRRNNLRSF